MGLYIQRSQKKLTLRGPYSIILLHLPNRRGDEHMSESVKESRQELIKHSAAIQIENNITLLQRRTWNVLLWKAYYELESKEEHQIALQELARFVGYDSHDMEYLKEASIAMLRCIVQYNVLNKDG